MADYIIVDKQQLRGTDSNSLLRMYDQACEVYSLGLNQQDRERADKTRRRIAKELEKRKVQL